MPTPLTLDLYETETGSLQAFCQPGELSNLMRSYCKIQTDRQIECHLKHQVIGKHQFSHQINVVIIFQILRKRSIFSLVLEPHFVLICNSINLKAVLELHLGYLMTLCLITVLWFPVYHLHIYIYIWFDVTDN